MVDKLIYPAYLDARKSRREGRRVPDDLAVETPTVDEIASAVGQVGYDTVVEREKAYARQPWDRTGRVRVRDADDATKNDLVQAVAAYVAALRS